MARERTSRAYWWLLAGLSLAPRWARADAQSDARELFDRARKIRLAGDCAGALPVFREAYDAYPAGLGSLRNVAECEQALGHVASARRAWLDLEHAASTTAEPKYQGWAQDAALAAAQLAPPPPEGTTTPAVVAAPPRETTERTAAWVAASVGVASLLGAGGAELERQSALRDADHLRQTCPGPSGSVAAPCTASQVQSVNDRGDAAASWETALLVAGAIGVSTGIALFVWTASRSSKTALIVAPTGLLAVGRF